MAQRVYEGMFLVDSNKFSRDAKGVSTRISETIEKFGGEVLVSRLWADQKLAYQIGNHRKGAYWLTYFRLDSTRLVELNRAIQLNSDVFRHLFIVIDHRLVDTLVRHAMGATTDEPQGEPVEEAADVSQAVLVDD